MPTFRSGREALAAVQAVIKATVGKWANIDVIVNDAREPRLPPTVVVWISFKRGEIEYLIEVRS